MLYTKESIEKQEYKTGETIYYKLQKTDNIPNGKKIGDKIKGTIKSIDKVNDKAKITWENGDEDDAFSLARVSRNKD